MNNELFKNAYSWLSEEEKKELALYIGMVELGIDTSDIDIRPIVMVAYNFYAEVQSLPYL